MCFFSLASRSPVLFPCMSGSFLGGSPVVGKLGMECDKENPSSLLKFLIVSFFASCILSCIFPSIFLLLFASWDLVGVAVQSMGV